MASLKSRIEKLEGNTMRTNAVESILTKHCRVNGWGLPVDKLAQLDVVAALAIKDDEASQKHKWAIGVLNWASTRPDLELLERAERIWDDYVSAGLAPGKPSPWNGETSDPGQAIPPSPHYCTAEQIAKQWIQ